MKNIIVGTAGHVDHGKTALIKRLTGVDTDRLKEEKDRGVSIVLGFAPLRLKNEVMLGIVDVPGHERFIRNMLIGASGMDFVLFVIAADDGVMPQTREHMDILSILNVTQGIVVITKADLVSDEWMALVQEDIQDFFKGTPFAKSPVVSVSSKTGEGIEELIALLEEETENIIPKKTLAEPRLAVDRSFSMTGFGTIVTGTLWGGQIQVGDKLEVFPSETETRVRGLQVHGQACETAKAGERVAVNLARSTKEDVNRGNWLAAPGLLKNTWRIDAEVTLLPSSPIVRHRSRVHIYHGAMETLARVELLDREKLAGGESAYAQLVLENPLCPLPGD